MGEAKQKEDYIFFSVISNENQNLNFRRRIHLGRKDQVIFIAYWKSDDEFGVLFCFVLSRM